MDEKKRRLALTVTLSSLALGAGGYYWLAGDNSATAPDEAIVRLVRVTNDKNLDKSQVTPRKPADSRSAKTTVRRPRTPRDKPKYDRPARRGGNRGMVKPKRIRPAA